DLSPTTPSTKKMDSAPSSFSLLSRLERSFQGARDRLHGGMKGGAEFYAKAVYRRTARIALVSAVILALLVVSGLLLHIFVHDSKVARSDASWRPWRMPPTRSYSVPALASLKLLSVRRRTTTVRTTTDLRITAPSSNASCCMR
ncbi:hypothetical protein PENTCL1PPCAC_27873, partial [Pristionchus entomophagus]